MKVPIFINSKNLIGLPWRLAISDTITLAEALTSVALPPKSTPIASAHQSGPVGIPDCSPTFLISGIMVATNGMLLTTAEKIADPQRTSVVIATMLPFVLSRRNDAAMLIASTCSSPVTKINSPMKKNMVVYSTLRKCSSGSFMVKNRPHSLS